MLPREHYAYGLTIVHTARSLLDHGHDHEGCTINLNTGRDNGTPASSLCSLDESRLSKVDQFIWLYESPMIPCSLWPCQEILRTNI